ncbi:hypothetical protein PIB30_012089 [Stylosanthes scabra]|uniref:F-box domain-containing protein n=1 Tax=Stylosanthes scabra TaxID=79078 RepID=A0ABU6R6Z9_9FABA|nr:hypothetical protein [Stylosanthes scabra]
MSSSSSSLPYLPEEIWEIVLNHVNQQDIEATSLVSRHFLSTTNSLCSSLTISDKTLPFLSALLLRFPNLTSVKLHPSIGDDFNTLLTRIASSHLPLLHSLDLSHQRQHGFSGFQGKFPSLKSLNCSHMPGFSNEDLLLFPVVFPNLEELDLNFVRTSSSDGTFLRALYSSLCRNSKSLEELVLDDEHGCFELLNDLADGIRRNRSLRSLSLHIFGYNVNNVLIDALLSFNCITCLSLTISGKSDEFLETIGNAGLSLRKLVVSKSLKFSNIGILNLLRRSNLLQHLDIQQPWIPFDYYFVHLSESLVNLISINLSKNVYVSELSFLAILRHCPLITEIKMVNTSLGVWRQNANKDLPVNDHVKVLCLSHNTKLKNETVQMIVSICPNLETMDLSHCQNISKTAIVEIFKRCHRINGLSLVYCRLSQVQFEFEFEVPTLFVLNLSGLMIGDEALSAITKSACRVKHLNLSSCYEITAKGVKQAVINCKQLKVISLKSCEKVVADVVDWMVLERPTLRKIVVAPQFNLSKHLSYGCRVVSDL